MQKRTVVKFGGTSVGNTENMKKMINIIASNPEIRIVVMSAVGGVTNLLLEFFFIHFDIVIRLNLGNALLQLVRAIKIASTFAPGISQHILESVKAYPIRLICDGASASNIRFLVNSQDANAVARILHQEFIEELRGTFFQASNP